MMSNISYNMSHTKVLQATQQDARKQFQLDSVCFMTKWRRTF